LSNKLTLESIFQVIDNHIESETQFMFVTDNDLAEIICEYVADNYDLIDEDMELSDEYKDYYVSLYIDEDGMRFICETARCLDGSYKYSDALNDSVDYFICNDMSEYEVDKYLLGDYCTWSWIEVVCEDNCNVCDECSQCVGCDEHCGMGNHDELFVEEQKDNEECYCSECNEDREDDMITECLDMVFDPDTCVDCTIDKVIETLYKFKELGYLEALEAMEDDEFEEDSEEKVVNVNINIDSLAVNTNDARDLIDQLHNFVRISN